MGIREEGMDHLRTVRGGDKQICAQRTLALSSWGPTLGRVLAVTTPVAFSCLTLTNSRGTVVPEQTEIETSVTGLLRWFQKEPVFLYQNMQISQDFSSLLSSVIICKSVSAQIATVIRGMRCSAGSSLQIFNLGYICRVAWNCFLFLLRQETEK